MRPRIIVRRDGKAIDVVRDEYEFANLIHSTHTFSVDHALRYEGYSLQQAERWPDDEAKQHRLMAENVLFHDPFHNSGGCKREGRLGRENCAVCVLRGYEPRGGWDDGYKVRRDGPNYAGWARIYVEAQSPIPPCWRDAFLLQLNSDNEAYSSALARSIATFGVLWGVRSIATFGVLWGVS